MISKRGSSESVDRDDSAEAAPSPPVTKASKYFGVAPIAEVGRLVSIILFVVAGGTGAYYRVRVLRSPLLYVNGDEAVTGIAGDLIRRGHLPVVVPGNAYGGTTESFLFAAFSWLPFDRALVLRCCSVALWLAAAVLFGWTAFLLAGRLAGLLAGSMAWVSGGAMTILSSRAYLGYASGLLFVAGCYLVAVRCMDTQAQERKFDGRLLLLGLLAGLAVWSHPMFISSVGPLTLAVSVISFRRVRTSPLLIGFGGLFALAPYLVWNSAHGWPALGSQPVPSPSTYPQRLRIFVTQLSPRGLGLRALPGNWSWGTSGRIVYVGLALLALVGLLTLVRSGRTSSRVVASGTLLILPLMGLFPSLVFFGDGRYFINVVGAWALLGGVGLSSLLRTIRWSGAIGAVAIFSIGFFLNSTFLDHTIGSQRGDPEAPVRAILGELRKRHIHSMFGSYWVMGRISLMSEGSIVSESMYPIERFPGFGVRSRMESNEKRAGAFPLDNDRTDLLPLPITRYDRQVFDGIVVYFPRP